MNEVSDIDTLYKTIIWMAEERLTKYKHQNINAAIHEVLLDMKQPLMEFMAAAKIKGEGNHE